MSEENVEIVRRIYDAYGSGNFDEVLRSLHEDLVFIELRTLPDAAIYKGRKGFMDFVEKNAKVFDELRWEIVREVSDRDQVVVDTRGLARGRSSGAETVLTFASVWTFAERMAMKHEAFPTFEEALEAAGLSE